MEDYGDRDMMAICAFRYCLGRRTYVVSECAAWLIRVWDKLDAKARAVIERDLLEEIKRDDDARAARRQPIPGDGPGASNYSGLCRIA